MIIPKEFCFVCFLFVCLYGVDRPTREFFHSYGDVTITDEGLQILTNARRSWPLSSEGALAYHTYCDTGHSFIMVTPRTRDTHIYCRAFSSGAVTTCFYVVRLRSVVAGIRTPKLPLAGPTL